MKNFICILAFIFSISTTYSQKVLTPMDDGSKVHFVIKNFGIKIGGDLTGLKGTMKFDPNNLAVWAFNVTVDAATINTDNSSRDGHLKKSDYFDVKKYQTIHIVSTRIEATDNPGIYLLTADLTIKNVTKQVKFNFKVNKHADGYLFTGEFEMNRRDFNVGSDSISLADTLLVSLSVFAK